MLQLCFFAFGIVPRGQAQTAASSFSDLQQRAEQARQSNNTEEQVALYRKAVTLRPSWGEGWWYLGTGLYGLHRYSDALDAFLHLSRIDVRDGSSRAMMGLCEFQLQKYPEALKLFFRAEKLGMGPNREMVMTVNYHIVILLNLSGQFEWAWDRLAPFSWLADVSEPVIEAVGINTLRLQILPADIPADRKDLIMKAGRASWGPSLAGHPEQAVQIFQELIAQYPKEPNLHYAYGARLLETDAEGALREFQKEIEINPTQVVARVQIVFLMLKRGDSEEALPIAREAVKVAPDYFLAHNALGRTLLAAGQTAAAIPELQTAVKLGPQISENHYDLAEAYRAAGRKLEATKERDEFERIKKQRAVQSSGLPTAQ
ncbi:MAG TPA: tetratricopeptide repeat protein [Candidatus Dormibacteraeota bacterium]|nr:tetratricopeptide repeat protein [Candidatus Dormibacteraeota bacterium]